MNWEEVTAYDRIQQFLIDGAYLPEGIIIDETDFAQIEREDPECACLLYCGLMKAAITHPEYFSEKVTAILSGYWLVDSLPYRTQISPDNRREIDRIAKSMFICWARRALSCVRTCSPAYYMLLHDLNDERVFSSKTRFEISRAMLYWKLTGNAQPGDRMKIHIQSQIEKVGREHSMVECIKLNRMYMWLNEPEKELYYAEKLNTRCFNKAEGFVMPAPFVFCYSVFLRRLFALIHANRTEEALKMIHEEISDLENQDEFHFSKLKSASLDDIERRMSSYAARISGSGDTRNERREMMLLLNCITELCEIGHWTACVAHHEEMAIEFKRCYTFYMHLSSVYTKYIEKNDGRKQSLVKWIDWLADHPFTPPTINTAFLEEDPGFLPRSAAS